MWAAGEVPQAADDERTGKGASGPEPDGKTPAIILGEVTGELVASGGTHIAHEINKPHRRCGSILPGQIHGQGSYQEHLRTEDAKADQEQNDNRHAQSPMNNRIVNGS